MEELVRALNNFKNKKFDDSGNFTFGNHEYVDIPGVKYDPKIKIMGLEVSVTLERSGFRIKKRRVKRSHLHKRHKIAKEEAMEFMKERFKISLEGDA